MSILVHSSEFFSFTSDETMMQVWSSPKGMSVLAMALASATHFSGYEWARIAVFALFTSERNFKSPSAIPLAVGCISPFSIGLLWWYTRVLHRRGPRYALRRTTLTCVAIMVTAGLVLNKVDSCVIDSPIYRNVSRTVLFSILVIQSGFVYLLSSQHWSFVGSVQSKEDGARWFAPIAGIGSISSSVAAFAVSPLVNVLGLPNLLIAASFLIAISAYCGDMAYQVAQKNGFEPKRETSKKPIQQNESLLLSARRLFARVPILGALCSEVLISQCSTSLISFLFLVKGKELILNDADRARWTGNCYAAINGFSAALQFLVLPFLMKYLNPRSFWLVMSVCMSCFSLLMVLREEVTLHLAAVSFCTLKITEYSLRGVANEMVYTSLDYESRFVGKEIIGLFANRFGKSLMAVTLFLLSAWYDDSNILIEHLVIALVAINLVWVGVSLQLNNLIQASEQKVKPE